MTVEEYLEDSDHPWDSYVCKSPCGEYGVAFKIGESVSTIYKSGDIIVFWEDGEHTAPDGCEFVGAGSLWDLIKSNAEVSHDAKRRCDH